MERNQEKINAAIDKIAKKVAKGNVTLKQQGELMKEVADVESLQVELENAAQESAARVVALSIDVSSIVPAE